MEEEEFPSFFSPNEMEQVVSCEGNDEGTRSSHLFEGLPSSPEQFYDYGIKMEVETSAISGVSTSFSAAAVVYHDPPQLLQPETSSNSNAADASNQLKPADEGEGLPKSSEKTMTDRRHLLITKISPDVYQFGNNPVQFADGKYICLTCARTFGGKHGKTRMKNHVQCAHKGKFLSSKVSS